MTTRRGRLGRLVRSYLSATNAAMHGVAIQAEAVIVGEHRLILTVEAARRESLEAFLAFVGQFGAVEVLAAVTAEDAVARGDCAGCVL